MEAHRFQNRERVRAGGEGGVEAVEDRARRIVRGGGKFCDRDLVRLFVQVDEVGERAPGIDGHSVRHGIF